MKEDKEAEDIEKSESLDSVFDPGMEIGCVECGSCKSRSSSSRTVTESVSYGRRQ